MIGVYFLKVGIEGDVIVDEGHQHRDQIFIFSPGIWITL